VGESTRCASGLFPLRSLRRISVICRDNLRETDDCSAPVAFSISRAVNGGQQLTVTVSSVTFIVTCSIKQKSMSVNVTYAAIFRSQGIVNICCFLSPEATFCTDCSQ
jgi:hypothetical protein